MKTIEKETNRVPQAPKKIRIAVPHVPQKAKDIMSGATLKIKGSGQLSNIIEGLEIWIVNFVLLEIIISGGRNEKNLYVFILSIGIAFFIILFVNLKKKVDTLKTAIFRGVSAVIAYALMDYLVINLILEKNSYGIYRSWGYFATYATILLLPAIIKLVSNFMSSRKNQVLTNQ